MLFVSHAVDGIFATAAQMDSDESSQAVINFNQRIEEKSSKDTVLKHRLSIRDVEVIFGQMIINLNSSGPKGQKPISK